MLCTTQHPPHIHSDPLLLSPLRATLSDTSSNASLALWRQQRRRAAMLSLVGQELLPRLLRGGGLDTAPLGQVLAPFPSAYDALVRVSMCMFGARCRGANTCVLFWV